MAIVNPALRQYVFELPRRNNLPSYEANDAVRAQNGLPSYKFAVAGSPGLRETACLLCPPFPLSGTRILLIGGQGEQISNQLRGCRGAHEIGRFRVYLRTAGMWDHPRGCRRVVGVVSACQG